MTEISTANATGPMVWVLGPNELDNLLEQIYTAAEVVIDLETTGLDEHAYTGGPSNGGVAARVSLAALTLPQADEGGYWNGRIPVTYILPLSHPDSVWMGTWRSTFRTLIEAIRKGGRPVNNQNLKFDARWMYATTRVLDSFGNVLRGGVDITQLIKWDTQVSSHIMDETRSTRLKDRAPEDFGIPPWNDFKLDYPGASEMVPLVELGEYACLAEGQRVITNRGLVPIEQVRLTDRLWDGIEWVRHEGVVFKGMRNIINYAELRATPDHLILTNTGEWACLASIATGTRRAASVTSSRADRPVSQADRQHSARAAASTRGAELLTVSAGLLEAGQRSAARSRRVSVSVGSEVRGASVGAGLPAVIQRDGAALRNESAVRREGDRGSIRLGGGLHSMGLRGVRGTRPDGPGVRPNRQRRALRAGQSAAGVDASQLGESPEHRQCAVHGADGCPRSSVGPREDGPTGLPAQEGRTGAATAAGADAGAGDQWPIQTRVYDILNAGPRYRFAVPGLIVSNCRDTWWTWRLSQEHKMQMFIDGGGYPEPLFDNQPETIEDYQTARFGPLCQWVAMPSVAAMTKIEQNGMRLDIEWARERLLVERARGKEGLAKMAARYDLASTSTPSAHATALWFKEFTAVAVERNELQILSTTKTLQPQWNKAVLNKLDRRGFTAATDILQARGGAKLSEFLTSWLGVVSKDGRVHANYNVGKVSTGRLSSNDPNMQQITKSLRPAWIARDGYVIADFDFSQLELRMAAFIANCIPMKEAFNRGEDLHRLLGQSIIQNRNIKENRRAAEIQELLDKDSLFVTDNDRAFLKQWFSHGPLPEKVGPGDVTDADRQGAKSANFGLLYLQTPYGFRNYAENVYGVLLTEQEAIDFHAAFFETWTGMHEWHEDTKRKIMRDGYITSPLGRVRRLPAVWSGNEYKEEEAYRQGVNSPVQGTGSDLMMVAAADIQGLLPGTTAVPDVFLVASVHDSVVAELPIDSWQEKALEIQSRMENAAQWFKHLGVDFDVPIKADYAVGTRWGWDDVSDPEGFAKKHPEMVAV